MSSTKQLNSVSVRCDEIADLVAEGLLDARAVSKELQKIIDMDDGKAIDNSGNPASTRESFSLTSPWRSAREQIERAELLFPYTFIPEPPEDFIPRTESEVLLLHMPTTLMKLRDMARDFVNFGNVNIREPIYTNPHKLTHIRPLWLGFDPKYRAGKSPECIYDNEDAAGPEVMSALIQFPDWPNTWASGAPMPIMTAYQLGKGDNASVTLCFDHHAFIERGDINIEVYPMNMANAKYALPRVRVLN